MITYKPDAFSNYLMALNPELDEFPENFDWEDYKSSVVTLAKKLSNELQVKFVLDRWESIQDATFSVSLAIPMELLNDTSLVQPSIRISNFGKLTTITCEHKVAADELEVLIKVIWENGFTYAPARLFGESFETRERFNGDLFNQLFDYV